MAHTKSPMSIHNEPTKIKRGVVSFLNSPKGHMVLISTTILGVSIAGFCLGIQSAKRDTAISSPVIIEPGALQGSAAQNLILPDKEATNHQRISMQSSQENKAQNPPVGAGAFVASKKGKKYYPIDCPSAKALSESNRIYFQTANDAESKGYTLATSCSK